MGVASIELPAWAWERADIRQALRARDIGAVFRHVQQYGGASQARIAAAVNLTQARVNEIINGRREISRLDVYERIADGLNLPDDARHLLGLAASREKPTGGAAFDLAAFPEIVRVYAAQASAREEIRQTAAAATDLDVLAVRGLGLIGLNDSVLRDVCLPHDQGGRGLRVRVLLLDPGSPSLARRAAEIGESAESLAGGFAWPKLGCVSFRATFRPTDTASCRPGESSVRAALCSSVLSTGAGKGTSRPCTS